MEGGISIIIPTLNEADQISSLIDHLRVTAKEPRYLQLIVSDGSSSDGTAELAAEQGAMVVRSEVGRAAQLAAGARSASHDILYFLHADGRPPAGFDTLIRESLASGSNAGCFRSRWDMWHPMLCFFGWLTRFPSILCRGGDQSLFINRRFYDRIGGFNTSMVLFEDIEIIQRCQQHGRFHVIPEELVASARRYREHGIWDLQWAYARSHWMYHRGFPVQQILARYKHTIA